MKSLILKDLYNIGYNIKSMFFILIIFMIFNYKAGGAMGYVIMCTVVCSMMVVTTFSFDGTSKWDRYALITPIKRSDIVKSKFLVLAIFSIGGVIVSSIFAIIGGSLMNRIDITNIEEILMLLLGGGLGFILAMFMGSSVIPLIFKFGVEKARMLSILAFVIPMIGILAISKISKIANFLGNLSIEIIGIISMTMICIWIMVMYKLSCSFFRKKEL